MKNFFFVICCIIILQGCASDELSPANLLIYDDQAGEKHNELVVEFLNGQVQGAVIDPLSIFNWAAVSHDVDLAQTDSYIFNYPDGEVSDQLSQSRSYSTQEALEAYENFDPRVYLGERSSEHTEYFNVLLMAIMDLTDSASSDPVEIASIITDFSEGIAIDSLLEDEEKGVLLSSLDVYLSSLELWVSVDSLEQAENPDGRVLWGPKDYWKVPVNDWIGGIAGAIMAGPAAPVGALVGGVSSSLMTWVGGQYLSRKPYNLKNMSTKNIHRIKINRGLIKKRAYYKSTRVKYNKSKFRKG